MRYSFTTLIVLYICSTCIIFLVSACATPKHTNTLIFGTNTKFALDAGVDATGQPSVTVGYKRQEAVWMPLLANIDVEGKPAECKDDKCLYTGIEKTNDKTDTYSVLASFGAKFSGGTSATSGAKAGGGLAQYFATGLAARKLAGAGAKIVSIQPPEIVSEEIKDAAKKQLMEWDYRTNLIIAYVQDNGTVNEERLRKLINNTGLDDNFVNKFKGKDVNVFKKELEGRYLGNVDALAKNIED